MTDSIVRGSSEQPVASLVATASAEELGRVIREEIARRFGERAADIASDRHSWPFEEIAKCVLERAGIRTARKLASGSIGGATGQQSRLRVKGLGSLSLMEICYGSGVVTTQDEEQVEIAVLEPLTRR